MLLEKLIPTKLPGSASNGFAIFALIGIVLMMALAHTAFVVVEAIPKIMTLFLLIGFVVSNVVGIASNLKQRRITAAVEQTFIFLVLLLIVTILVGAFVFPDASFQYYWNNQFK